MSQYYYDPFGGGNYFGGNNYNYNEEMQRAMMRRQREQKEKSEIRTISLTMGIAIIAYLVVQMVAVSLLPIFGLYNLYLSSSVFQNAFNIIGVSFFSVLVPFGLMGLANKKRYAYPVIPNERIKPLRCCAWITFGIACCLAANYIVSFLITFLEKIFGITFGTSDMLEPDSPFACVMLFIGTAIIPALCEELAMRCCALQLLRKYGNGFAVFSVSIVFGLLHGNVVQFLFAFIVGVVLGFATVKTNSIIPAIFIHMGNNTLSCMSLILTYACGEKISNIITIAVYAVFFALGVFGLIYLLSKGELKNRNDSGSSVLTNGQKFSAFLLPWMIVPFLLLIVITAMTITGN